MDDLKTVLYQDMYCYDHKTFHFQQKVELTLTPIREIEDITFVEMVNNKIIHILDMDGNNYFYPIECLLYFYVTRKGKEVNE